MSNLVVNRKIYDALGVIADKKNSTRTTIVTELLTNIGIDNDAVKPVVLQIPVELLNDDKESLKTWLECRTAGILKLFYP